MRKTKQKKLTSSKCKILIFNDIIKIVQTILVGWHTPVLPNTKEAESVQVRCHISVLPDTQEAEAEGSCEPRLLGLAWATKNKNNKQQQQQNRKEI